LGSTRRNLRHAIKRGPRKLVSRPIIPCMMVDSIGVEGRGHQVQIKAIHTTPVAAQRSIDLAFVDQIASANFISQIQVPFPIHQTATQKIWLRIQQTNARAADARASPIKTALVQQRQPPAYRRFGLATCHTSCLMRPLSPFE